MSQKIEIIRAEKFNWYKVGDILELAPEQKHVTLGVQVIVPDGYAISDLVIHGNYKDYVEVAVDTVTEELVFTVEIKDTSLEIATLSSYVTSCIEQIQNQTNLSFEWTIESKQLLNSQISTSKGCYQLKTIKDSHFHLNTTLWTQACLDFVCLLKQKIGEAHIRAYSTPVQLYNFTQK